MITFQFSYGLILTLQSDLASAMPTAGGLYWWTHYFAGERYKKPLSFLIGYSNTLGLIGGICSVDCESIDDSTSSSIDFRRYTLPNDPIMRLHLP